MKKKNLKNRFLADINLKEYETKFNKETVTEELDNIPEDRFLHSVDPRMSKMIMESAEYDYRNGDYTEGSDGCTNDLICMDKTEREVVKKRAEREIEYKQRLAELEEEEKESKEITKRLRTKTKKKLEEEK